MSGWEGFGKLLMGLGVLVFVLGLFLASAGRFLNLGHLPGDIFVRRGNFTFYFPLVTSLLLSLILTVILNLFRRW